MLNTMRIKDDQIVKAWQLNERHYGALTGLNKDEMRKKLGENKFIFLEDHGTLHLSL